MQLCIFRVLKIGCKANFVEKSNNSMKKLDYTLQFITPAFLGNAYQSAQWRTPPFKTMLRQWWRVLKGHENALEDLRTQEGDLFGAASGNSGARQSKIRLRLQPIADSASSSWLSSTVPALKNPSPNEIYIGYGPVQSRQVRSAIPIEQKVKISLILANSADEEEIRNLICLCNQFATLGSRAKNGWGSVSIHGNGMNGNCPLPTKHWQSALKLDWPHALGTDNAGKPLIWKTTQQDDWRRLMSIFSSFRKEKINKAAGKTLRPYVSYPVTNNNTFTQDYRLPSQLIFKAKRESGKYIGYIAHFPHCLPEKSIPDVQLIEMWEHIHNVFDEKGNGLQRVTKITGFSMEARQ